ncbi:signal peptidase I [Krasilnikovia sp. MM14-A1259]|uniref:signal peptidase I n=1 Tax=Krasilnikovia sp. MM14-A1259 TaxID=3373539 RepID=UPI0037F4E247
MSAVTGPLLDRPTQTDGVIRRWAYQALAVAVRGRGSEGGPWGEAALREFSHTRGTWEALSWSFGGIRTAVRERRARSAELPAKVRLRRRIVVTAIAVLALAAGVHQWVLTPMYVPSGAMEPGLQVSDRWLMDRVGFRMTGLHHGDVVAFRTEDDDTVLVRRVIGLPGDTITCRDGRVLRNGTAVDEPYLAAGTRTECPTTTVTTGSVYLLADNRGVAVEVPPVSGDRVEGRMLSHLPRFWPVFSVPQAATASS